MRKDKSNTSTDPLWLPDAKLAPLWNDDCGEMPALSDFSEGTIDVAIVGAGYTGLNAAIELARAGRQVVVFDAGLPGEGCSSRNGGQISTSIKPSLAELTARYDETRARAIRMEGVRALDWIEERIAGFGIDCDFKRAGGYHAAHSVAAYDALAREVETENREEGAEAYMVSRADQRAELGADAYCGGAVFPRHASLQPAKYLMGLLEIALADGVKVVGYCKVHDITADGGDFILKTARGRLVAGDVIVATNGYTSPATPWLHRRIVPIGSYMMATQELPRALMDEIFPTDRMISDTRKVVYYYRPSPDRKRMVFGGRVSANETDPRKSGPKLHAEMCRLFPKLADAGISHSWCGTVAFTFDETMHAGVHGGVHYAMGYCGTGISMASYLGMRLGQKLAGKPEGKTAFDDLPFPTRPFYSGKPWFLPAVVAFYRWQDNRAFSGR